MKYFIFLSFISNALNINGFLMNSYTPLRVNSMLNMSWAYPLFDDSPSKPIRRKINQAFERGPIRTNASLTYEYANRLAQNMFHVPGVGELPYNTEEGLGHSEDIHTSPETACGGVDIDEKEFNKIRSVYKVFNDNNCGVVKIIGAKMRHFSFLYLGPMEKKYGIKCYLRYLINRVYPGSKVTVLTPESHDPSPIRKGVYHGLFSKQKRFMISGRDFWESYEDGLPTEGSLPQKLDMLI
ncbi:conserved hypothetical protein [Theileria orientalis strain Shintoku]|uniref:Uncharacterized protein n=1 Tax=Theileria orientalis strain Shintoku TaxID=869250 RepID=J4C2X3_THEOR|nr:conserved hypothetical protein [Theileria orientalis strain Shintoku]BAM39441.1 conserved hypothetical protein [Theileria orientalis strain Shintoku]|eukprot:XP_009689742.1 conserved hypothetical protein [Theileria orientalis strain Shintoku]